MFHWIGANALLFCAFLFLYLIHDHEESVRRDKRVSLTPVPRLIGKTYVALAASILALAMVRSSSHPKFVQCVAELTVLIGLETAADGWAGFLAQYDLQGWLDRRSPINAAVVAFLLFALSAVWWAMAWSLNVL